MPASTNSSEKRDSHEWSQATHAPKPSRPGPSGHIGHNQGKDHTLRGPIARATIRTSGVLGLRLFVQAGTLLLVAHLLGPEQFGAFAGMAALAVMLGALSTFGTHLLLLREISCAPELPAQLLPAAVGTTLMCGGLLLAAYLLLATVCLAPQGVSISALFAIGVSDIVAMPLLQLPAVERQGHGQIARSQLLMVLPLALRLVAAIGVAAWHPDEALTIYSVAYATAALVSIPVGASTLRQNWPRWRTWRLLRSGEWREAGGFAALNLTALGPNELDKALAVQLLPAMAAGTYAASSRVMGPLVLPVLAMMMSALPRLFRDHAALAQKTHLLRVTLLAAMGYGLLAASALWLSAPVIAWAFGDRYADLPVTLRWLALAVPGMSVRYVAGTALVAHGSPWLRAVYEVAGVLVLVAGAYLLTPRLQDQGMAAALAVAESSMAIAGFLFITGLNHRHAERKPHAI